jgi:hypothetical protein
MGSRVRASRFAFSAWLFVFAAACGGTSVSHGDGNGMAGMSQSGGTSGTTGGSAGTNATGGTGATSGSAGTNATGGAGATSGSAGTFGKAGARGHGGTAGASGSGGAAGNAGSGGTTACVTGGLCSTDGAQCSESSCCSCQHTCKGGVWGNPICPPCAAPLCPQNLPVNGDACSPCSIPDAGCTWDQRSIDGPVSVGQCVDDHWIVTQSGSGCCTTDMDCGKAVCVVGRCQNSPPGVCWTNAQCGADEVCSGAFACGCGVDCFTADEPGTCVPANAECCVSDSDCGPYEYCFAGVCKTKPSAGCWTHRDCENGALCFSANVCPCGSSCLVADAPGTCGIP